MSAIESFLRGTGTVTTDNLIEAFDEASSCETEDCAAAELHTIAAEIAQKLREYKALTANESASDEEIFAEKDKLMDEIRAWGSTVELMALLSNIPPSEGRYIN